MKIQGTIQSIIYRNDESGYTVANLENGESVVGHFSFASAGGDYNFTGEYVESAKYGKQFKVQSYEQIPPTTPAKIQLFIGSGLINGVGPATAQKIVATFGADTLAVMEHRPSELTVIRGISLKKAESIGARFMEVKGMQKGVSFLQQFGISLNMAIRVFNHYKEETIAKVRQNPYDLIEKIDGIGFLTADEIAKKIGVSYLGKFRIRAGIVHVLKTSAEAEGHTCLPIDKLFAFVMRLLVIKADNLRPIFDEVLNDLCMDKYLSRVGDFIALSRYFNAEKSIAERLDFFRTVQKSDTKNAEELLTHYEKVNNIKLHKIQRDAVLSACTNGVTVITGGPGTGKTTIIKAILLIAQTNGKTVQLLAPTGRAAKRLEETTGMTASTIHRALDIDYKGGKGFFTYDDPENVLRGDVIIVDEVSMCDATLMSQLLKKVLCHSRIVLVGDIDQLASVGAGNVLADIIASGVVPVTRLTEIYRQEADSKIVFAAHNINRGEMPDISNKSKDFFFISAESQAEIKQKVIEHVTERLPKYLLKLGLKDKVQVLCPMKAGDAGMTSLNLALQETLNPKADGKPEYVYGETVFRMGDRVMQTANNYMQEWTKGTETGTGVFNGDIGEITSIETGEVRVRFEDGRESIYIRSDLSNLVPSYAITVHKSQGCEFDAVVIPITSGAYMVLTRNLLYTAVTRAKALAVLVGSADNIKKMVENTYTKHRYTLLKGFLLTDIQNR